MKTDLAQLKKEIEKCALCPRLLGHCEEVARKKKREFRDWGYWGKPVPAFGDPNARLWIVGLAPAAHGANRTGRMFTGDKSGEWLYRALFRTGFANRETSVSREDGLVLNGAYISAAARCAPPDNKPTREELARCFQYLEAEAKALPQDAVILALGRIAFEAVLKLLGNPRPRPQFGHNVWHQVMGRTVITSYHPSRQNTQTGRLTEKMWMVVFEGIREELKKSSRA